MVRRRSSPLPVDEVRVVLGKPSDYVDPARATDAEVRAVIDREKIENGIVGVEVREIENNARRLVTIGPDHPIWIITEPSTPEIARSRSMSIHGSIVRVRPPASATDAKIREVVSQLEIIGPVAIKVDARQRPDALVKGQLEQGGRLEQRTFLELVGEEFARLPPEKRLDVSMMVNHALELGRERAPKSIVPESTEPLWCTRLELHNWFRFRAVDLLLRPVVYGVTAKLSTDAARSNWLGKSTFLWCIAFALTGDHPADYDDAWLTPGEDAGNVRLTLSDGSIIDRSKRRGASTKVVFLKCGDEAAKMVGEAAKDAILRHIGLTPADYFASAFVRQGELDRLVSTDGSSEAAKVVMGWLNLAPIREAHKVVMEKLDAAATEDEQLARAQREASEGIARVVAELEIPESVVDPEQWAIDAAIAAVEKARVAREEMAQLERSSKESDEAVAKYRADVDTVAKLRAVASILDSSQSFHMKATGELAVLKQEERNISVRVVAAERGLPEARDKVSAANANVRTKRKLVVGQFDGQCPVAGIDCPAKGEINADRARSDVLLLDAEKVKREADAVAAPLEMAKSGAEQELAGVRGRIAAVTREKESIERSVTAALKAKEELAKLPEPTPPATVAGLAERLGKLATERQGQLGIEAVARRAANALKRYQEQHDQAETARARTAEQVAVHRHAARILGPGGVQQSYARAELGAIEDGANALLQESTELRVAIEWGYESPTALAHACGSCGAGYPAASRAKTCARCGEARGPKIEEKVRILPSRVSGAARDMAGVAVQVAASAWLRTSRGSAWQSCSIDEPFGSLDGAHGRALGAHLASLLGSRLGFRQGFVVAHSAAAMDAMPARLVITGEPGENGASTIAEEV